MKRKLIFIFALFLTLTGFRIDEKAVKQNDVQIFQSAYDAGKAPKIVRHLQNLSVFVGEDVTFSLEVENVNSTCKIVWYKDGRLVVVDNKFQTSIDGKRVILKIRNVTKQDAGKYGVKISNEYGAVESSAQLTVEE